MSERPDSQPNTSKDSEPVSLGRSLDNWLPVADAEELNWLEDADRAISQQNPVRTRALLYVIVLVVIALVTWAAYAEIDEVTRGEGKVIPSRQVQVVQSQDGGVVTELAVAEGDAVEAGQLLVKLDATRSAASFRESRAELLSLEVKAIRLQAVAEERDFEVNAELQQAAADVVAQEQTLYRSSMDELKAAKTIARKQIRQREQELQEVKAHKAQLDRGYSFALKELRVSEPLLSSGAVSEIDLLRLRREVSRLRGERAQANAKIKRITAAIDEAQGKLDEVELDFKNTVREELSRTTARINALRESSRGLSDRVEQTAVRSPVRGTVKRLYYNTIGGVVLPGREVIEVVPLDDALLLEARINPRDIAFLRPGQDALVKFTAYDFVVYGGLDATVEHISADTVIDEEGNPFYLVRVRTFKPDLGEGRPIIPGMVAEVDILTGKKSILSYLLKPVLRAKQYALSER